MLKLVSFLFLTCLANASYVNIINDQVDKGLEQANSFLTAKGYGLHPIPDHKFGDVELKNGVHVGFNSLQRSGNCTVFNSDSGPISVDLHIGWRLFEIAYGSVKTQGLEFSGVADVRDSSFHIAYDIEANPDCKVTLTHLEYERLADAQFSGSLPETDKDISDTFAKHVVPYLNGKYSKTKAAVEHALQESICGHPKAVLTNGNHVTTIVDAMVALLLAE